MRRALAWAAVCLLTLLAGALVLAHLCPDKGGESMHMSAPEAALRQDERMPIVWPAGSVNPNLASVEELDSLPGIGPALAARIVEERETNGSFIYPEDLLNVSGIGLKTLEKLWEQLFLPQPDFQ